MVSKQKKIIWWSLLALILFSIIIIIFEYWPRNKHWVQLGDQLIKVEIADQPASWYQGLSDRSRLCNSCGLLFVFPEEQIREFVMRRMNFPLDIVFINNERIIKIATNLPPEGLEPKIIYSSDQPVDQVLEIPANYCQKYNIKIGDPVFIIK